ncbi:MAG: hypothetical protein U0132_15350 [Gemmatimonadaceae bacterium]
MTLSVVVTVVDGGATLERCLQALATQEGAPPLQVLVPYDATVTGMEALASRFPAFTFLPMGVVATEFDPLGARGQHELFDRRRSHGLAAATGDVIGIVEDRGVPTPDWAATVMRLQASLPYAVIGGAVQNASDRLLNWAVYFCDFGRYARPFVAGERDWVTDVNVSYKRRAIDATRQLWQGRYHEPVVHRAIQQAGDALYLTPEFAVFQMREPRPLRVMLDERLQWGRLFAYTRIRTESVGRRFMYLAAAPLIPVVLFLRQARLQQTKGNFATFMKASPLVALLLLTWSVGEAIGYFTGKP